MAGRCTREGCYPDIRCAEGEAHKKDCKYWKEDKDLENTETPDLNEENAYLLSWSGNSIGLDDINILAERSNPILLGSIGATNSGKTTFWGLLYLLLNDGQYIPVWDFSNSYTLLGWEYIANYLRYEAGSKPEFPPHTSSFKGRDIGLLHLGLFKDSSLQDIALTDVPGEWFSNWSVNANDDNAGSAPWIHKNSRGFFLFIDCEGLAGNEVGKFRLSTIKLIRRLVNDLKGRPVAVLWSKADLFHKVKAPIKKIIQRELNKLEIFKEFKVSIHHGNNNVYHKGILKAVSWLLNKVREPAPNKRLELSTENHEDLFIAYRGGL